MATLSAVMPASTLISKRDTTARRETSTRQRGPWLAPLLLPDHLMRRHRRLGLEEVVARPALRRVIARRERAAHGRTAEILQGVINVPEELAGADSAQDAS